MAHNFLILGTLAALGWAFVNGSPPSIEPAARSSASHVAAPDSSKIAYAATCLYHLGHPGVLVMEPAKEGDGHN